MKLGFIGMGNMAAAIASGALKSGYLAGKDIIAYDPYPAKLDGLTKEFGIIKAADIKEAADFCELLILAVKPDKIKKVIADLGDSVADKAIVSIALGWSFTKLSEILPKSARIQAVMPNTPMQVGQGVCLFEEESTLREEESDFLRGFFQSVGIVQTLPSALMGAGAALSGCGPAFAFLFIEALADGAVYHGIARKDAYTLAAQTLLGAAAMVLETGLHPGELKDNVCSPGGATIRGVAALEEKGFRAAAIEAIHRACGK